MVSVIFTEEVWNGKLHFLCSDKCGFRMQILKVDYKSESQNVYIESSKGFLMWIEKILKRILDTLVNI